MWKLKYKKRLSSSESVIWFLLSYPTFPPLGFMGLLHHQFHDMCNINEGNQVCAVL